MPAMPATNPPDDRGTASTRDKLIRAALDTFSTAGFDGASARQIERSAGVERGLIAYHFGSKQVLWAEAVDSLFARFSAEHLGLRGALRDVSRRERARAMLMAYARFNARNPEFFRILILEGHQSTERSDRLAAHLSEDLDVYRGFTGMEGPTGADDAIAIYLILGAAGALSATSAYHRTLGLDTSGPDFVDRFARAVAALSFGGAPGAVTTPSDLSDGQAGPVQLEAG